MLKETLERAVEILNEGRFVRHSNHVFEYIETINDKEIVLSFKQLEPSQEEIISKCYTTYEEDREIGFERARIYFLVDLMRYAVFHNKVKYTGY